MTIKTSNKLTALVMIVLFAAVASVASAQSLPAQPECLDPTGVRGLIELHPELTGQTVSVAVVELSQTMDDSSGYAFLPNFEHKALSGVYWRGLYCYHNPYRPVGCSDHASIIAGILFGYDPSAAFDGLGVFEYRGIIPGAMVDVYETNWFIYKRVLAGAEESLDSDVVSISWGTDADDPITMWWQRGLDAMAVREGLVVVAAAGNGSDQFDSISKPSLGYNVISVGAAGSLGAFPGFLGYLGPPVEQYSTFGPAENGRCKPDLIAPGLSLAPNGNSNESYHFGPGSTGYSSFAAPQVSGIASLLIDAARNAGFDKAEDPRVIRALLLNGANKLVGWHKGICDPRDDNHVPLDYQQGAGLVDAWNSYRQLSGGRYDPCSAHSNYGWDLAEVSFEPDDVDSEKIYYLPEPLLQGEYLTATLCWYRHYQQSGIFKPLPLNSLRLELWSVDQFGLLIERLDYSDSHLDNLQHIYYHHNGRDQNIAFLVSGADEANSTGEYETYALAFAAGAKNWAGDRFASDLNADGIVDVKDLMGLLRAWWVYRGTEESLKRTCLPEDINGDGLLDNRDFNEMAEQWLWRSAWYRPEI